MTSCTVHHPIETIRCLADETRFAELLSLKAGLTIFFKDVVDVVIRVNLYFLHNEMKIS